MENNIDFEYKDIDEDEQIMEEFNLIRDKHEIYESVKAAGKIGIPTFIIDGKPYINIMNNLDKIKKLLEI